MPPAMRLTRGRTPRAALALLLALPTFFLFPVAGRGEGQVANPVVIDFFFRPGCEECARVKEEVLPELATQLEGFYLLNMRDREVKKNYLLLSAYQERLGIESNAPVSMVVDGRYMLNGVEEIRSGLIPL